MVKLLYAFSHPKIAMSSIIWIQFLQLSLESRVCGDYFSAHDKRSFQQRLSWVDSDSEWSANILNEGSPSSRRLRILGKFDHGNIKLSSVSCQLCYSRCTKYLSTLKALRHHQYRRCSCFLILVLTKTIMDEVDEVLSPYLSNITIELTAGTVTCTLTIRSSNIDVW